MIATFDSDAYLFAREQLGGSNCLCMLFRHLKKELLLELNQNKHGPTVEKGTWWIKYVSRIFDVIDHTILIYIAIMLDKFRDSQINSVDSSPLF